MLLSYHDIVVSDPVAMLDFDTVLNVALAGAAAYLLYKVLTAPPAEPVKPVVRPPPPEPRDFTLEVPSGQIIK